MGSRTPISRCVREVLEEAAAIARETGFIQRERQVSGAMFFLRLVFGWFQNAAATVEDLRQVAQQCEITVCAAGLSKRFPPEAAAFMQRMLQRLTQKVMQAAPVDIPLVRRFRAVIVEDRSSITLPGVLAAIWQGGGGRGSASEAAVKLPTRWDRLSGA